MKKNMILSLLMLFCFTSISVQNLQAKTIEMPVINEKKELVNTQIPFDPQRIVCLNHISVDILDNLGLGDRIVGMMKNGSIPAHLKKYADDKNIVNLGSMKDINMEAMMSLQPDLIFSSDRTVTKYKEFLMIAPTIPSFIDYSKGFYSGFKENARMHAKVFGKETEVERLIMAYDERLAMLQEFAKGKNAMLGIFTGGSLKSLGDNGRISIITHDIGFKNVAAEINVNHGNTTSYELIVQKNPDYLFILDKDQAVGENTKSAKELLDNELVRQADAYKNNQIVFLSPSNVWYVADGGIISIDIILKNLEEALLK